MNAITSNPEYKDAFLHWCLDHHKHFGCWPGSFIYAISETEDIDFPESVVWEAVCELFPGANGGLANYPDGSQEQYDSFDTEIFELHQHLIRD